MSESVLPTRINHIGIFVADLEKAVEFAQSVFGLEIVKRGTSPALKVETAFLRWGEIMIEFIHTGDPTFSSARLGGGLASIDHIAITVSNLDEHLAWLLSMGIVPDMSAPLVRPDSQTITLDPTTTLGIRMQLVEIFDVEGQT